MKKTGLIFVNNKIRLTLNIERYEFPSSTDDWDSNWLNVNVKLEDISRTLIFKKTDPCILTMELVDLHEWFCKIKETFDLITSIKFTEPGLVFMFEKGVLTIQLGYEMSQTANFEKYNFKLNDKMLVNLIKELECLIIKFPKKFNPS